MNKMASQLQYCPKQSAVRRARSPYYPLSTPHTAIKILFTNISAHQLIIAFRIPNFPTQFKSAPRLLPMIELEAKHLAGHLHFIKAIQLEEEQMHEYPDSIQILVTKQGSVQFDILSKMDAFLEDRSNFWLELEDENLFYESLYGDEQFNFYERRLRHLA